LQKKLTKVHGQIPDEQIQYVLQLVNVLALPIEKEMRQKMCIMMRGIAVLEL